MAHVPVNVSPGGTQHACPRYVTRRNAATRPTDLFNNSCCPGRLFKWVTHFYGIFRGAVCLLGIFRWSPFEGTSIVMFLPLLKRFVSGLNICLSVCDAGDALRIHYEVGFLVLREHFYKLLYQGCLTSLPGRPFFVCPCGVCRTNAN